LVLGCGFTGRAVARLARERGVRVTTNVRSNERADALRAEGFVVRQAPAIDESVTSLADADTHVVVAFPPDGTTDGRLGDAFARAAPRAITYVSTLGVYGDIRGVVDDTTPLPSPLPERSAKVLGAERAYREIGGTILRCPGIYGPDRGLHVRVTSGKHQIPGDGTRYLSRIHVDDLATLVLACADTRGETFVVGDLEPAIQLDLCTWLSREYDVPLPPFVPLESVHETLRADRRADPSRALRTLGVTLRYPTYREGMKRREA
jgi:nucleoside-diphosphate-sugar epimerase